MHLANDQIERAAEALRNHIANRCDRGRPWEALPEQVRQKYRDEVKAVATALNPQ